MANRQWTPEEAWAWYDKVGWQVGCNYVPKASINGIETWQEEGFEQQFAGMLKELDLMQSIGYNTVRMGVPMFVWVHQRDGFIARYKRFLDALGERGITMMPVFFGDCVAPKEMQGTPRFGPQRQPIKGYHGGAPGLSSMDYMVGYNATDDPESWPEYEAFVRDIVTTFKDDERIIAWDIWNEPGNHNRNSKSYPFMKRVFDLCREIDPIQPLTAGSWCNYPYGYFEYPLEFQPIELKAMELSDVVSYHYYGNAEISEKLIQELNEKYKRPLFITEWLHRCFHQTVKSHLPLFKKYRVSCYDWGLVAGKTQTYEPWDSIRDMDNVDLTVWQHDLFHEDFTPYDPEEIALIMELCLKK